MTFTYNGPVAGAKDEIRFLIQDTDARQPLLTDEEIDWMISTWGEKGGPYLVASKCCDNIAMKFAREVSYSSDSQSVSLSELMSKYQTMAAALRSEAQAMGVGELFVGGSVGTGTRGPSFRVGMHDDPGAGPQDMSGYTFPHPEQWGLQVP